LLKFDNGLKKLNPDFNKSKQKIKRGKNDDPTCSTLRRICMENKGWWPRLQYDTEKKRGAENP